MVMNGPYTEAVKSSTKLFIYRVMFGSDAQKAFATDDAQAIERLFRDYLSWEPILPMDRKGKVSLKDFAALLAPLCRMLRDDVADALKASKSPLVDLANDWRQLLFPDASNEQFADAYAQTVTFALLLGRSEGAHPLTLETAEHSLAVQHSLLSRALQVLTDPAARAEMSASLDFAPAHYCCRAAIDIYQSGRPMALFL